MWKSALNLLLLVYSCKAATNNDCVTPLDTPGKCIMVSDCSYFTEALAGGQVEKRTLDFMKQSKCGCDVTVPRVCCGPLPTEEQFESNKERLLQDIDPDSLEDSKLASEDKCGLDFSVFTNKIYGGQRTKTGELPWLALLWYSVQLEATNQLMYLCGGSIINQRYVLTAAHCIARRKYEVLDFVRLGENDISKNIECTGNVCADPPQDIKVLSVHPHTEYNRTKHVHDIGLIRLVKRIVYSEFVQPLCLDRMGQWNVDDQVVAAGWGQTQKSTLSLIKLKVKLPVVDRERCAKTFPSLNDGQVCLGGKKLSDTCQGDSGGPAMRQRSDRRWQAIAVVSYGIGCGVEGRPAVYTAVHKYHDWIIDTMQATNLCPKAESRFSDEPESCTTPLGQPSQCISLYECQDLLSAFERRPLPSFVVTFLRKSQCGFLNRTTPAVCCGPLPEEDSQVPVIPVPTTPAPNRQDDGVNADDANPSPVGECGVDTNGDRIYGGQFTELDEFPWMALLGYRTKSGRITYQCGGVLINHRYVLTAAHCLIGAVEREIGKLVTVRLGEYDTQSEVDCSDGVCADPPQEIPVAEKYPNRGYNDQNTNKKDDIGLVRLSQRARYTYYVKPICLPGASTRLSPGYEVYVAGWGKTLQGTNSPVKLKLQLPVFEKNECVNKYKNLGANLIDKQICAGGNFAKDACRGDSGGPLMVRTPQGHWESVGIVSFGYGCGRDGWPGVYTSVAAYKDWILSTMRSTNS
ncbi:phenoloxidase-activating enzyme 1-like isoform X1 [Ostrinia nubilalis]|uniref:phenoloxidase-activating enzyme 1-like isoform X1 n=1 Tax=Ostrinia nubilalis TaxID=29057 RepID=UPI0030824C31